MNLNNIGITWFRNYFIEKANIRIKRVMRLGSICYVPAMGHRKYIKQFIVAGTWILNKLII